MKEMFTVSSTVRGLATERGSCFQGLPSLCVWDGTVSGDGGHVWPQNRTHTVVWSFHVPSPWKNKNKKVEGGLHSTAFWQCLSSTGLCLGPSHPPEMSGTSPREAQRQREFPEMQRQLCCPQMQRAQAQGQCPVLSPQPHTALCSLSRGR